jgi:hypothetical protein
VLSKEIAERYLRPFLLTGEIAADALRGSLTASILILS